jgi:deoxyadenosine/deoxycytidine kinase
MANQAKVKLYDQLIKEGLVELREAIENVEVEFRRWHFEQVKNYVNALDVAYQRIVPNEETKDEVTIEGEVTQVEEEGKLTEIVEKVKQILANVNIVDIFDEDETITLSQFYFQSVIKE